MAFILTPYMAENTDEEFLDNPKNPQMENPHEDLTPTKGTETMTPKQETKNVETNQPADASTKSSYKNSWKSYFQEFLMLFLAVFLGFVAQYQLENMIEKETGKQYISSFYEDLLIDSSHFNFLYNHFDQKLSVLQTMSPCYDSLMENHSSKTCLSIIMQNSLSFLDMVNTDRTMTQLKNAGGLRLLKKEDADKILDYDKSMFKFCFWIIKWNYFERK